jgi:hypothetical protein
MTLSKSLTGQFWARLLDAARKRRMNLGAGAFATRSRKWTIWTVDLPADGNRAAYVGTRDFGTSPIFVQLPDKPLLASV